MNAKTSRTADEAYIQAMPPALVSGLKMMIHRVRRIMWLRGIVATAAVLLFSALAIMAVDATTMLESPAVRWGLWSAGLLLVLATAWTMLVKPLSKPLSLTKMARVLETRHPDLQERISSVLELKAYGESHSSSELLDILTREALLDMDAVSPRHEFTFRSAKPFLVALGVSAGVLILLMAVWPRETFALVTRAVAPLANVNTIGAIGLEVTPGDTTCLRGTPFTISISAPADEKPFALPEIRIRRENVNRISERMRRTSAPNDERVSYALPLPSVSESFSYEIQFGTGLTRRYNVTVLPPPEIQELTIAYEFPTYTDLAPTQYVAKTLMNISTIAGTRMRMSAKLNTPVDGTLLLGSWRLPGNLTAKNTLEWQSVLTTNAAPRYGIMMRDRLHGYTNDLTFARVSIQEDQAPSIEQLAPGAYRFTINTLTRVPFAYNIYDDFGLSKTRLLVRDTQRAIVKEIPLKANPVGRRKWNVALTTTIQGIPANQSYTVTLEASDNLPVELGGPHVVESMPVTLILTEAKAVDSILAAVIKEQVKALKELIEFAASSLQTAASQVEPTREHIGDLELEPELIRQIETAITNAKLAEDALVDARDFARDSVFPTFATAIDTVQRENVRPAYDYVNRLLLQEFSVRQQKADETVTSLKDAAVKVRELLPLLEELEQKALELAELQRLAAEEQDLANKADDKQMTKDEIDDWLKKQKELAEEADKNNTDKNALDHMDEAMRNMEENTPMTPEEKTNADKLADAAQKTMDAAKQALDAGIKAEDLAKDKTNAEKAKEAAEKIQEAAEKVKESAADTIEASKQEQPEDTQKKLDDAAEKAAEAANMAKDAAEAAKDAAENLQNQNLAESAQKAETAADMAAEAADMAKDAAADMENAMEEQQNGDNPEQAAADQAAAEKKAEDAAKLADEASKMAAEAAKEIGDQLDKMEKDAADAADAAKDAAGEAQDAKDQLPEDAANPDLDAATDLAEKAAGEAENAVEMSKEGEGEADQQEAQGEAQQAQADAKAAMAAAQKAADAAAAAQAAQQAQQQAAQQAQQAAQALGQQAKQKGEEMGLDMQDGLPKPGPTTQESKNRETRRPGDDNRILEAQARANSLIPENWMRLRGKAQSDALDAALQNVSPEYRELVREYFLQLSRENR